MNTRTLRDVLRRPTILLVTWVILAELLIPLAITFLYHSDSVSAWHAIQKARAEYSLAYYIDTWHKDSRWAMLALIVYMTIAAASTSATFVRNAVGKATPGMLGAIRMLVASILLASTLWEHLPSSALLPRGMIHGEGILAVLYVLPIGFDRFVASPHALAAFQGLTAALLLAAAVGWRTRWTVPASAVCYLIFGGILRQYAWFYHTGLIPLYVLIVLSWTPCGDGFSLDRVVRVWRGEPVADADRETETYGWSRYLCWVVIALPYAEAGLSKLRRGGIEWLDPLNIKRIVLVDTLNPMQFNWRLSLDLIHAPDAFFWLIGVATILAEVGFGLVLVSRRARLVMPAVMALMHVGILLMQNVLFFDLILLQVIFYDLRPLRRRVLDPVMRSTRAMVQARAPSVAVSAMPEAVRVQTATAATVFGPTPAQAAAWPGRLRALAAILLLCWAIRLEAFPFTAMQMYSKPDLAGVAQYHLVTAKFESGEVEPAPIEAVLPALRDARYRRIIRHGFDPKHRALAQSFLEVVAEIHNERAEPGQRIMELQAERWRWDFVHDSDDPQHGRLQNAYTYTVSLPASTAHSDRDALPAASPVSAAAP
jgi:hypothetical protein